jgi:uncharacterized protein YdiU (UPF0061 family)
MTSPARTRIDELRWENRFVQSFPGDRETRNFTRQVKGILYSEVAPTPVNAPALVGWSDALAEELGIVRPESGPSLEILAGNRVAPGQRPYASRYGGHQFGHWAGQLGDGRAITLGEAVFHAARKREFQLKGAGPTPYSRTADGRAVMRSSLREFLCSEAMHHLGIPTTRALSLVATGEPVVRDMFYDGRPRPEPGAVVCRVAPTFLRFGHFEILAASGEIELLRSLVRFAIEEHFPDIDPASPDATGLFLDAVAVRTARLMAHWMRVGFVHGVMNTDNMSIVGDTIDYGPYGWLESYDPGWTPNTTDAKGRRYRYGGQPNVALWNLACLGQALMPLLTGEDRARASLESFQRAFGEAWDDALASKLGFARLRSGDDDTGAGDDDTLVRELLGLLPEVEVDFTNFFRALCDWPAESTRNTEDASKAFDRLLAQTFYVDTLPDAARSAWLSWLLRYSARAREEAPSDADRAKAMKRVNPRFVPRNFLAQEAIVAAEKGDAKPLERLVRVLSRPYDDQPEDDLARNRPEWARSAPGCSALSCSS